MSSPKPSPYLQSSLLFLLGAFIGGLFLSYLYLGLSDRQSRPESSLPVFSEVPDFHLIERSGEEKKLNDLKGRVWVANFIFTTCPTFCTTMTLRMQELQGTLRKAQDVQLVSFSIDPEYDTPEILTRYAKRFRAKEDQWWFLTGNPDTIYNVAQKGFLLGFVENPADEQPTLGRYSHSSKFAIVDSEGRVRAYHDGMNHESIGKILNDIGRIMREEGKE